MSAPLPRPCVDGKLREVIAVCGLDRRRWGNNCVIMHRRRMRNHRAAVFCRVEKRRGYGSSEIKRMARLGEAPCRAIMRTRPLIALFARASMKSNSAWPINNTCNKAILVVNRPFDIRQQSMWASASAHKLLPGLERNRHILSHSGVTLPKREQCRIKRRVLRRFARARLDAALSNDALQYAPLEADQAENGGLAMRDLSTCV